MTDGNENEQEQVTETAEPGENGTEPEVLELTEEAEGEPEAEPERPKGKSVQKRFDEITAARREAERDAEYWRRQALEKQPEMQPQPVADARPDPASYEFGDADPAYWDALTEWKADQKVNAKFAELEQKQQVSHALRELETGYSARVAEVKAEIPDYDEVVTMTAAQGKWPCPPVVALAAKESPVGPKVLHHLATNLSEAVAISNLSPIEQAMAFGRLEARFSGSQPTANIATNAPQPAPARTKGGQFASTGVLDDRSSTDDWMKRREAQLKQS